VLLCGWNTTLFDRKQLMSSLSLLILQSAGKGARMDSSSLYSCSYTGREGVELLCSKPFPPSSEGLIAEDCQGLEKGKLGEWKEPTC